MEFKGTKGKLTKESHIHPLAGYLILDESGYQIAIVDNEYIDDLVKCEANAVLFSKAPEMLKALITIRRRYDIQPDFEREIDQLIKEATEI